MIDTFLQYFANNPETGTIDLNWVVVSVLIFAGFLVGIVNTIAGSGTAITYSLFMMLGLPANIANGTIRFGVIMQTFSASAVFYKNKKLAVKKGILLALPVIAGTVTGAQIATQISHNIFEKVLGMVMILMLIFIFYDPKKWLKEQIDKISGKITIKQILLFFTIGVYGGFIHIGVGLFLLSALVMSAGYDLIKANALKVFIVFLYSPFALAVFILNNQVNYKLGLISAIGNVIGGIIASKFAISKGAGFVRWFLVIVILLFAIKLLLF
jgi:uncharacterized membrane protein YfcA